MAVVETDIILICTRLFFCCTIALVSLTVLDNISNTVFRRLLFVLYTQAVIYTSYRTYLSDCKASLGRHFVRDCGRLLYHHSHYRHRQVEEINFEFIRRQFRGTNFLAIRVWGTAKNGRKSFYIVLDGNDFRARVAERGDDWIVTVGQAMLNARAVSDRNWSFKAKV
jgi:hypothetical protein